MTLTFRLTSALLLFVLTGCTSDPDPDPGPDGGGAVDASHDMGSVDGVTEDPDAARDAAAQPDMPAGCVDACATLDFTATVGANSATFDRAIYGLTAPDQSASGAWEVHVEVHAGGVDECPTMSSPSPDQTVIITNIPLPAEASLFTEAEGLVVSMLDFAGTVTDELPLTADGEELQWVAWEVCTDCTGDDSDGFLAFELTAPVAGGTIGGHVYATHCASLDAR